MTSGPLSCWIVLLDIENFGMRDDAVQAMLRREMYQVAEFALTRAGVDLGQCLMEDRGDGVLILIPSATPPTRLLQEFTWGLENDLVAHQERYNDNYRMRLRVGLNHGPVVLDSRGRTGTDIADLARLVDAEPVRQVFARASRAHLVLVVSDNVYRSMVRGGDRGIDLAAFGPTDFVTKHGQTLRGWVTVPGYPALPEGLLEVRGDRRDEPRGDRPDGGSVTPLDSHVSDSVFLPPHGVTTPMSHTPPGPLHDPDDDWPRETPEP
ncbi:hypothetical protein [Streptomyces sp. NPDC097610]|uniref:hypothetical protein n=1 Tax=Streptomyces sp. NPDC097610 TaxID=3157227 RepID=UPI003326AF09